MNSPCRRSGKPDHRRSRRGQVILTIWYGTNSMLNELRLKLHRTIGASTPARFACLMVRNAKRANLIWSGTRSGQALFGQDYLTPDLGVRTPCLRQVFSSAYGQVYLTSGGSTIQNLYHLNKEITRIFLFLSTNQLVNILKLSSLVLVFYELKVIFQMYL